MPQSPRPRRALRSYQLRGSRCPSRGSRRSTGSRSHHEGPQSKLGESRGSTDPLSHRSRSRHAWSRLRVGHCRRQVVLASRPSFSRFPFPVLSSFPCNTFCTKHSSHSLSTSEAGEDKIHLSGPIVEHRKDEHNMENGKKPRESQASMCHHESPTTVPPGLDGLPREFQASTGHHESSRPRRALPATEPRPALRPTTTVPQASRGHHKSPPGLDGPPREF
jgi:hypothetical protein